MNRHSAFPGLRDRSASAFLVLLLLGDLGFVFLHLVNAWAPGINLHLLELQQDRGHAEIYQYLKFTWICGLLVALARDRKTVRYLSWAILFVYFLLDDALEVHEIGGGAIVAGYSFVPPFGLRLQDVGELVVSAVVAAALLPLLAWAYISGSREYRSFSRHVLVLVLVLVFFGVVVDTAHSAVVSIAAADFVVGLVEDGGEMLAVSLIVWRIFLEYVRGADSERLTRPPG